MCIRDRFEECPVPVLVAHYLVGWHIHTGGVLIEKDRKNPVAESYFVHSHGNRDSWDLVASYVAIFGADGVFTLSEPGRVTDVYKRQGVNNAKTYDDFMYYMGYDHVLQLENITFRRDGIAFALQELSLIHI